MEHLDIPQPLLDDVLKTFRTLPMSKQSSKIILTFELNCGPGGTLADVEFKHFVQRKWRKL